MATTTPIRYALIGCGFMGEAHAWAARNDPRSEVSVFVDTTLAKAEAFASTHGGAAANDYRRALDDHSVDGVIVALPHRLHWSVTMDALAAGKHVMVEKPISLSLEEADDMIAAAHRSGLVLFVAHVLRFRRSLQFVKSIIERGSLGRPFFVRYHNEHYPDLREGAWLAAWEEGGVFLSGAIHHADLMCWWMGEVKAVTGHAIQVRPEYHASGREDHTMIVYNFESGAIGESTYSYAIHRHNLNGNVQAYLAGDEGELVLDYNDTLHLFNQTRSTFHDEKAPVVLSLADPRSRIEAGSAAEVPHFTECILEGKEPIITAHNARRALELVLAARQSAREGRTIAVPV